MSFRYLYVLICWISLINAYPSNDQTKQCLNFCSNDGVCVITDNSPECYCLPEWEGERCDIIRQSDTNNEIEVEQVGRSMFRNHPCSLAPADMCLNGGICQFENKTYSCLCSYKYIGKRCQDLSPCEGYCKNGGLCNLNGDDDPICTCNGTGFTGLTCQKPVTTKAPPTTLDSRCTQLTDVCLPGVCAIINGLPQCQYPTEPGIIPPGPTNPSPVVNGKTCAQNPCQNNRPCYNNGNTYFCYCGSQYSGTNCEVLNG